MLGSVLLPLLYLLSAVLFILGLKGLTRVRTARRGNALAALAMLIAIVTTLVDLGLVDYRWIATGLIVGTAIGAFAALRVEMTSMPELVALPRLPWPCRSGDVQNDLVEYMLTQA